MATSYRIIIYKNTKLWLLYFALSIIFLSTIFSASLVHAKSQNTDRSAFQKKILGQWVYVEAGEVKGVMDFFDKEYLLLNPSLIEYGNYSLGSENVIVRWSMDVTRFERSMTPIKNKDGEIMLSKGSYLINVMAQFINLNVPNIKNYRDRAKFLKKPYRISFTEPKDGRMSIFLAARSDSPKLKVKFKKLINIEKLKKTNPGIYTAWELKRKKTLSSSVPQLIYNTCHSTWKFRKSAFTQCLKFEKKYKEYGFAEYKPLVVDLKVVSANKFLLNPISNYSDSTELPSFLSYESLSSHCPESRKLWLDKLAQREFSDTLWTLKIQPLPRHLTPDRKDVETEEYKKYEKALVIWANIKKDQGSQTYSSGRQQLVHLRKDGVIGLSWDKDDKVVSNSYTTYLARGKNHQMVYDPANRWTFDGTAIYLKWQNGLGEYKFGVSYNSKTSVNAKYETAVFRLVQNHLLLMNELSNQHFGPGYFRSGKIKNAAHNKLIKKVKEESRLKNSTQRTACKGTIGTTIPPQASISPSSLKQQTAKKKSPKLNIKINNSYWHARIVLVDPKMPIDPTIKAMWGKGAYLHLRKDGRLGFNWSTPNGYGYAPNFGWVKNGNKFTITMGDISYTFDTRQGDSSFITVDNNAGTFRMTMETKSAGQK